MQQTVCTRLIVALTLLIYDALGWSFQQVQHQPPTQRQPHNQRMQEQHRTLALPLYLEIPKTIKGHLQPVQQPTTALYLNSDNGDGRKSFQSGVEDQETLLRISLSVNPKAEGGDYECDDILDTLQAFIQAFPFAAVLPVQPLTYKPRRKDGDGLRGVDVVFLRKKTKEKGSEDGGISFDLENVSDCDDENTERRVDITAVRNAEGQFVSKVFSEGVIIKAFTKSFCETLERDDANEVLPSEIGSSCGVSDDLSQMVSVNSIYHKWM